MPDYRPLKRLRTAAGTVASLSAAAVRTRITPSLLAVVVSAAGLVGAGLAA